MKAEAIYWVRMGWNLEALIVVTTWGARLIIRTRSSVRSETDR